MKPLREGAPDRIHWALGAFLIVSEENFVGSYRHLYFCLVMPFAKLCAMLRSANTHS